MKDTLCKTTWNLRTRIKNKVTLTLNRLVLIPIVIIIVIFISSNATFDHNS